MNQPMINIALYKAETRFSFPAEQHSAFGMTEDLWSIWGGFRIAFISYDYETRIARFKLKSIEDGRSAGNSLGEAKTGAIGARYGVEVRADVRHSTSLIPFKKETRDMVSVPCKRVGVLEYSFEVPTDWIEEPKEDLFPDEPVFPALSKHADSRGFIDVVEVGKKTFMNLPDELISQLRVSYADTDQLRIMVCGNVVSPRTIDITGDDAINMKFKNARRFRSLGFKPGRYEYDLVFTNSASWSLKLNQIF